MKNEHLTLLANIILSGEPLPLSWVVANQNEWDGYWRDSQDPAIMIRIAGHVVSREKLVFTVAQIMKPLLKYEPIPKLSRRVVKLAENWTNNKSTLEEVIKAYYVTKSHNDYYITGSMAFDTYNAAKSASDGAHKFVQILTSKDNASASIDKSRQKSKRKIANIIRKHIRITVADLVSAGRQGWNPPSHSAVRWT